LKSLTIQNTKFTTLPAQLGDLKALTQLRIIENKHLKTIPTEIDKLVQLRELNLKGNHLTHIPETLGQLTSLEKLDLSDNSIELLPSSIGHMVALEWLSLSGNNLKALPKELGSLTKLTNLALERNPCLTRLPYSLAGLTKLTQLTLDKDADWISPPKEIIVHQGHKPQRLLQYLHELYSFQNPCWRWQVSLLGSKNSGYEFQKIQ
jgi:Leucine-rich repeat (LRR) protein